MVDSLNKVFKNHTGKITGGAASIIILVIVSIIWPGVTANTDGVVRIDKEIIKTNNILSQHSDLLVINTKEHLEIKAELTEIKNQITELKDLIYFLNQDDPRLKKFKELQKLKE